MNGHLTSSTLSLANPRRGKVRDVYDLDRDRLLIVASDRLSAFDVVLPTPIPGKGRVLTKIAGFWLGWIQREGLCPTHLLSLDAAEIPDEAFADGSTSRDDLVDRVTIGQRCDVVQIECVARGYLEGSGWSEYQQTGGVCGVELPAGLERCSKLPEPIFTPATKAADGEHDENISFEQACDLVGADLMTVLRERTLSIYRAAAAFAEARGILIADTKFEFGFPIGGGREPSDLVLVDEALTPDSSRFWPASEYAPGRSQPSFDKQFVREYLESLVARGEWDKTDPGPVLPQEVIDGTLARYAEARDILLGQPTSG